MLVGKQSVLHPLFVLCHVQNDSVLKNATSGSLSICISPCLPVCLLLAVLAGVSPTDRSQAIPNQTWKLFWDEDCSDPDALIHLVLFKDEVCKHYVLYEIFLGSMCLLKVPVFYFSTHKQKIFPLPFNKK